MLIKRIRLASAKDRNGNSLAFYYTQPDKRTLHFTIGRGADQIDIYVAASELLRAMYEVRNGAPYVPGKHAQKEVNDGETENR